MDERGFPTSLPEFQKAFPDDTACAKYLEKMRWPNGFSCPTCGHHAEPYRFKTRSSVVLRCRECYKNTSLTAGTVMQKTRTPLSTWFWAAYLATTQTPGQSAVQFQRQLGVPSYETAFQILHKLRAGMVRPDRDSIGGEFPVEVDECFLGGRTTGEGKGVHHKTTVIGAVEIRDRAPDGKSHKRSIYAGRIRLKVLTPEESKRGRDANTLTTFVKDNVSSGSVIRTDGWRGYSDLAAHGYVHESLALCGDPAKAEKHLPMIHLIFSNLKAWLLGTHHGVSPKHLQSYLNEYVFRFNRRFYPMTSFHSVLGIASHTTPPTYDELYSGEWSHPA